ncbi:MAG TPA: hypothetical protein VLT87_11245 [Thermoanaerobaculia bacterium]|nr:hypothetical protein [Thermoanaerobaculia bacterium]
MSLTTFTGTVRLNAFVLGPFAVHDGSVASVKDRSLHALTHVPSGLRIFGSDDPEQVLYLGEHLFANGCTKWWTVTEARPGDPDLIADVETAMASVLEVPRG